MGQGNESSRSWKSRLESVRELGGRLRRRGTAFFERKQTALLNTEEPRFTIQPWLGCWLCPYCAEVVSTPEWDGAPQTLSKIPQVAAHLAACPAASAKGKAEPRNWGELTRRTAELRLRSLPAYRFTDGKGLWICPYCLKTTEVLYSLGHDSHIPDDLFCPEAMQHLENCAAFHAEPLRLRALDEVRSAVGNADLNELLFARVVSDPIFRVPEDNGAWICPFCEKSIERINLLGSGWNLGTQKAVVAHLLEPSCPGRLSNWRTNHTPESMQRLAGKRSGQRDSRRLQAVGAVTPEVEAELKRLREQVAAGTGKMRVMEKALTDARKVQIKMLPHKPPLIPRYEISAFYEACEQLGGDLFNFIPAGDGFWGLMIGDVSGHGIDAALMMAAAMKSFALRGAGRSSPRNIVRLVNNDLLQDLNRDKFVSVFYAVLNLQTHKLRCVRAGHCPALLVQASPENASPTAKRPAVEELTGRGSVLGVLKEDLFVKTLGEFEVDFPPRATLLLYTDGLTETMNAAGEEFGMDRLRKTLYSSADRPIRQVVEGAVAAARAFAGGRPMQDDLTVIAVRRVR